MHRDGRIGQWLGGAPPYLFVGFAIAVSFSTYFCMYAFRKPFAAGTYEGYGSFAGLEFKSALVISQIIGYAASKYVGIKVCSEVSDRRRAGTLVVLISSAQLALIAFALAPPNLKIIAIFLNGLPLGMVWGLVVRYLEGRQLTELLLAGLSCSYILASGIVKDIGLAWIAAGVPESWMPSVTGACFLPLFLASVWLLNQIPPPNESDVLSRVERPPMSRRDRRRFTLQFWPGLTMLFIAYVLLTAYRDFRDNYGIEIFTSLGYGETPAIFARSEIPVAFGVMVTIAALNLIRNHRRGLVVTYAVMTTGVLMLGGSTLALDAGWLTGHEVWWMILVGLGAYLAYVPYNAALFERVICSTRAVGTAVFAIYVADALGYTGSVAVQIYKDLAEPGVSRFEFFRLFTYVVSGVGAAMLLASGWYFVSHPGNDNAYDAGSESRSEEAGKEGASSLS